MQNNLTQERLREVLDYNPETGIFTWRVKLNRCLRVGSIAGTTCRGRIQIRLFGVIYRAHRLAWFHVYGYWPPHDIDHVNGNPSDNSLANLRLATKAENRQNVHRAKSNNSTGLLGVSPAPQGGFRARLCANGVQTHLGCFKTAEEAHVAYLKAKRKHHPFGTI